MDKLSLYEMADVFIMPSHHENFGLAAAEAMSAGIPVIVSDQVGLADDIAEHGGGLIVTVNSASEVAGAVKSIYEERSALKMGAVAKEVAQTHFSFNGFSKGLMSMYNNVLVMEKNKS